MPQFVKILAKVTKRLQALVSVEITRSTAAFWPIVAVCMRRFERPQRVGKRSPTREEPVGQRPLHVSRSQVSRLHIKVKRLGLAIQLSC